MVLGILLKNRFLNVYISDEKQVDIRRTLTTNPEIVEGAQWIQSDPCMLFKQESGSAVTSIILWKTFRRNNSY